MYSTHNQKKHVIAERLIRTLEHKIYKYTTSVSKNMYIDKLDDIVNKYNNAHHSTIKMKPVDVIPNIYFEFSKEINNKDGDVGRILKYKNIFRKGYTSNWPEEVFVIKTIKNSVPWTYIISDLTGEEIVGILYEK